MENLLAKPFATRELIAMCSDDSGRATILLNITRKRTTKFGETKYEAYVINGGWNLSFPAETGIAVKNGNEYSVVWRGTLPLNMIHTDPVTGESRRYAGYDIALAWINQQIEAHNGQQDRQSNT